MYQDVNPSLHRPISHNVGQVYFNYRVCGIAMHNDRVLMVKISPYSFWLLPGGRTEYLETSKEALEREIREELGMDCEVGTLAWIVEDLYAFEGEQVHELGFYYTITLPPDADFLNRDSPWIVEEPAKDHEAAKTLTFYWLPLEELSSAPVIPSYIKEQLKHLPHSTQHLMIKGEGF